MQHHLKFIRVAAGGLAWGDPCRDRVRERIVAVVVEVERGESVIVEFDETFVVQPDDTLFVCGTPGSLESYLHEFETTLADGQHS